MDWKGLVNNFMSDERLLANLVGLHVVLVGLLAVSVLLRKVLKHGRTLLARWTGLDWLDGAGREATHSLRALLFWVTVAAMGASILGMAGYHAAGRDARLDVQDWYAQLTGAQLLALGVLLGKAFIVGGVVTLAFRLIRRLRILAEFHVHHHLPRHVPAEAPANLLPFDDATLARRQLDHEQTVRQWFHLLERSARSAVVLTGVWVVGRLAALTAVDWLAQLLLSILAIFTVARLLTLSCRTLTYYLADLGNRTVGRGQFNRYWERITRLFAFGERCFEAAVYIAAASLCVHKLDFIAFIAHYGENLVKCIGIFFGTRVVIELLTVFVNELFGMYDENRPVDQKGRTLVPLLQSICQYVLYFGSVLFMMDVFEIPTAPILASAGIIGLAIGLGAQSLVTDLVSGFFILFENQYLVGDIVEISGAVGRVEAISIRHTQIRDEQGKLYIIPNGQIKTVTNFSKGFVNAVVDIKVPTSTNLEQVVHDMAEAGRRLRKCRREVLGDTVVKGLVDLSPSDMVVRAVTRVEPGSNQAMQREYRRLLKEVFDERQAKPREPFALAA